MTDLSATAEAIEGIIRENTRICDFWGGLGLGWAPRDASRLLEEARLDRQVALSHTLRAWLDQAAPPESEGRLILGWANLGALVEGTMKWFLCVYEHNYSDDPVVIGNSRSLEPDELYFSRLCNFYDRHVWTPAGAARWSPWYNTVRRRRNAIHSYQNHDIGDFVELHQAIREYLEFIQDLDGRVPYPDEPSGYW